MQKHDRAPGMLAEQLILSKLNIITSSYKSTSSALWGLQSLASKNESELEEAEEEAWGQISF